MTFKQKIIIKDDPVLLAKQAAEIFVHTAEHAICKRGVFTVALSGGSTPRQMHKMLAGEPHIQNIQWEKTHIFWVDERCVSQDSLHSSFGMAKRDFIEKSPIFETHVHGITCRSAPQASASAYQNILGDFFSFERSPVPRFDLIFLGMGKDGHTASLFPGQTALDEKEKLVVAVKGGNPSVNRITMTLPLLNQARHIVFLITGQEKAKTVQRVFEDSKIRLPVQKIRPANGRLTWLLDCGAASFLTNITPKNCT